MSSNNIQHVSKMVIVGENEISEPSSNVDGAVYILLCADALREKHESICTTTALRKY